MNELEKSEKRKAAARKGAITRKKNEEKRRREWNERGQYERHVKWDMEFLQECYGNVILENPSRAACITTADGDVPAVFVGTIRISLTRVTITPTIGLHPASVAFLTHHAKNIITRRQYEKYDPKRWAKGVDEDLSECYKTRVLRVINVEDLDHPLERLNQFGSLIWDLDPLDIFLA